MHLKEYKKEKFDSTEKIIVLWIAFIMGFRIYEQISLDSMNFMFTEFILKYLPGLFLLKNIIYTWIHEGNTIYLEHTNSEVTQKNVSIKNVKFIEYLKNVPFEHPIIISSLLGLIISKIYFVDDYNRMLNILKEIPLLGGIYENWFSVKDINKFN